MAVGSACVVGAAIHRSRGAAWSFLVRADGYAELVVAERRPVLERARARFGAWSRSAQATKRKNEFEVELWRQSEWGILVRCRLFVWRDVGLVPLHFGSALDGRRQMLTEPLVYVSVGRDGEERLRGMR